MLKPLALILALIPGVAIAAPWKLDPATTVTVYVGWAGLAVPVSFPSISGDVEFDQNNVADARASIAVASAEATTGVAAVDALMRSADYLGADRYPQITFRFDRLVQTSKSTADIFGRITLRGVTRPAKFQAKVFRFGPAADDAERFEAGFDVSGAVDRTKFGSTGWLPEVAANLPVRIHLLMISK